MKRFLIIVLAVIMIFSLTGCIEVVDGISKEEYDKVVAERDALLQGGAETETGSGTDISTLRGIAYELLFDLVYHSIILGEDYDFDASVDNKVEQFDLSESEESELLMMLKALFTRYGFDADSSDSADTPVGSKFDKESVLSQLEVTEYSYSNDYWHYAFLVIKNNSEYDLNLSASVKFYNDKGELIGAKSKSESPFSSDSEIVLYFMPDEKYTKMEYEFNIEEEEWHEGVVHDLSYESTPAKNKEIVSVTNNGKEAAEFVEVYALFFDGDRVVGFDNTYFADDDSELKPGKTITKELDCYDNYTSVRFFFTGRRLK